MSKVNLKDEAVVAAINKAVEKAVKAETKRCLAAVKSVKPDAADDKTHAKGMKDAVKAAVDAINSPLN